MRTSYGYIPFIGLPCVPESKLRPHLSAHEPNDQPGRTMFALAGMLTVVSIAPIASAAVALGIPDPVAVPPWDARDSLGRSRPACKNATRRET